MHNLGRFETVGRFSDELRSIEGVSLIKLNMIKLDRKMKGHQGALTKAWISRTLFVDKGFLDLSFCRQKLHRQKFDKKALFSDNAESEYGLFLIAAVFCGACIMSTSVLSAVRLTGHRGMPRKISRF